MVTHARIALVWVLATVLIVGAVCRGRTGVEAATAYPPPKNSIPIPTVVARATPLPPVAEEPAAYPPPRNLMPTPTAVLTPRVTMTETVPGSDRLVRYRGETAYGYQAPMIEVIYDGTQWTLGEEATLVSTTIPECTLFLREGSREYFPMGAIELGGRWWGLDIPSPAYAYYLIYSTRLSNAAAIFRITLPGEADMFEQGACKNAGEAVLATFREAGATPVAMEATLAAEEPTAYPPFFTTSTPVPFPSPVVTPLFMMTETVPGSDTLVRFQSATAYDAQLPMSEITYDRTKWTMPRCCALISTTIPECRLLVGRREESFPIGTVELAGRPWNITIWDLHAAYLMSYSTPVENGLAIYRITLPDEAWLPDQVACRDMALEVLKTFRVLEQ